MQSIAWTQKWLQQPDSFYSKVAPTPLDEPFFVHCNAQVGQLLGLDLGQIHNEEALRCFNGQTQNKKIQPLATVYAGHQFGIFTSRLGDGRAILLGEVTGSDDKHYEIQLKGAGLTPYSRTLDGRYVLSAALKEYVMGEALTGLGIPTTRALCLVGSHSEINQQNNETCALLVRVAQSHLRFGHFEYFHHRDDFGAVKTLFDFVIEQLFPELLNETPTNRPLLFLQTVIKRTAKLIALWQSAGFIHGVMNTDNMTLTGETLDLGPCGFMQVFDPNFTPNSADDQGRYQFDQQPDIGRWNCLALAQALLSLLPTSTIPAGLLRLYRQNYQQRYLQAMREKLGWYQQHVEDMDLVTSLLVVLARTKLDYSEFFRCLARFEVGSKASDLFVPMQHVEVMQAWLARYQARLTLETVSQQERQLRMNQVNPAYILRESVLNQLIKSVEQGDFSVLEQLILRLQMPYAD